MATGIEINRSNIELPNDVSAEILQKTQEASAVMQLARQMKRNVMVVDFSQIRSKWVGDYYMTESGVMATNTWIDGKYYVGPDGKWIPNYTESTAVN